MRYRVAEWESIASPRRARKSVSHEDDLRPFDPADFARAFVH